MPGLSRVRGPQHAIKEVDSDQLLSSIEVHRQPSQMLTRTRKTGFSSPESPKQHGSILIFPMCIMNIFDADQACKCTTVSVCDIPIDYLVHNKVDIH